MTHDEAIEWLEGKRSMINSIPSSDYDTLAVRVAQADAAMTQIAYYVWMYQSKIWNELTK